MRDWRILLKEEVVRGLDLFIIFVEVIFDFFDPDSFTCVTMTG